MDSSRNLWYLSPASVWTEALPLGNGRIGAMAFGGVSCDRFSLNEDTVWSGYPREEKRTGCPDALKAARGLMDKGDFAAAQRKIEEDFTGSNTTAYLPLGDLLIKRDIAEETSGYIRSLDIMSGVHTVEFSAGEARHEIRSFMSISEPQGLIIDHKCSMPGGISEKIRLDSPLRHVFAVRDGRYVMLTECPEKINAASEDLQNAYIYSDEPERRGIRALTQIVITAEGGNVSVSEGGVSVKGADRLTISLCVRTSFNGYMKHPFTDGADFEALSDRDALLLASIDADTACENCSRDFHSFMDRMDMSLSSDSDDMPTDKRLEAFYTTRNDSTLYELLFNFGRYLMVAGSQPGTQATNLQGIWNANPLPPWNSNYTVNINTEMNYYPAEIANLSELHSPLFDLAEKICNKGHDTAKMYYNARGSVCHHNTDLWGLTNPVGEKRKGCAVWSHWPMSLAWICHNVYEHYQYTLDEDFLKNRAVPVMREAILFLLDVMVPDERGYLRIYPGTSPENAFYYKGENVSLGRCATMSNAICREIMKNYLEAAKVLKLEDELTADIGEALSKIWPYEIGSKGQILEWDSEYEEVEPTHRHTSHLYGLYPGHEITPEDTPELANAARRTLELRGDDGTGWSLGWKLCFFARLNDGDHAMKLLNNQLRLVRENNTVYTGGGGTYPNMFDAHPPFQIDGNFGSCAGICELFVHSVPGRLTLLPALPSGWKDGHMHGLKAMGNIEADVDFREGKLEKAIISVPDARALPLKVIYEGKIFAVITETGTYTL